jgi:hypothetical protein
VSVAGSTERAAAGPVADRAIVPLVDAVQAAKWREGLAADRQPKVSAP